MDLFFFDHRTRGEDGTPPPSAMNFGPCDNRVQSANSFVYRDESDSDGQQPKWSAAAAKKSPG